MDGLPSSLLLPLGLSLPQLTSQHGELRHFLMSLWWLSPADGHQAEPRL